MPAPTDEPAVPTSTVKALAAAVADDHDLLVAVRRQLHAHPEPSGEERATTLLLDGHLRALGLDAVRLASGTGLVADLPIGRPRRGVDRVVALRADIDALAMSDDKDVAYRSQVDGVAHACGHDVHTAAVLGAARALAAVGPASGAVGTIRLVFEPSEETVPGGAVEVVEAGWLDDVMAIFGVHCDPKLDVGRVGCRAGAITSAADQVEFLLSGPGGHTARPGLTVDLVQQLGLLVTGLQPALDSLTGPSARLQVGFGAVRAGDAPNVIPAYGLMRGTLRTPDHATWVAAPVLIEQAVDRVLGPSGDAGRAEVAVRHFRGVPPVVNSEQETRRIASAAEQVLGPGSVVPTEQSMGGDSFAWYLEQVPGSYVRLGVHDPASRRPRLDLHASTFDVDERAIGYGAQLLALTALHSLTD